MHSHHNKIVLAVSGGVVKLLPVATGVPPVGVVYQLTVALAGGVATSVAVCPLVMVTLLVATVGATGGLSTNTVTGKRTGLTQVLREYST